MFLCVKHCVLSLLLIVCDIGCLRYNNTSASCNTTQHWNERVRSNWLPWYNQSTMDACPCSTTDHRLTARTNQQWTPAHDKKRTTATTVEQWTPAHGKIVTVTQAISLEICPWSNVDYNDTTNQRKTPAHGQSVTTETQPISYGRQTKYSDRSR